MRRPVIAGNWKMYKTVAEAVALAGEIRAGAKGHAEVVIAPPFTALAAVAEVLRGQRGRPRRPEHALPRTRAPSRARSRP